MGTSAKIGLVAVLVLIITCAVVWDRRSEAEALQFARRSDPRPTGLPPRGPARITSISSLHAPPVTPPEGRVVVALPAAATAGSNTVPVSLPVTAPITGSATAAPAATLPPAAPAAQRRYTVQKGDTFSSIAKRLYGTEARWPAIAEANRDRVSDPSRLMPGTELVIPTGETDGGTTAPRASAPRTPTGAVTHTVAQEETLFSIAAHYYGTGSRWPLIAEANRDRIEDPHRLKPGMVLVIPPATEAR
ncbi:MAG: LysM peptidoglycan-binding domain-containing protein [Planctomycetes bacterium]|nr:LysM peptidoglycan-binding domain-containing protein [Planctomycetota bacterium]